MAAAVGLALAAWDIPAAEKPTPPPGVVVESVGKGFAAEKAGIKPGDILTSWERAAHPPANPAAAHGEVRSPFEVREVETEQAPRGRVTLILVRDGKQLSLALPEGEWRITTRPVFSAQILASYGRALERAGASEVAKAVSDLRNLSAARARSGDHLQASWLLSRAAQVLQEAHRSEEAARVYDDAIGEVDPSQDWQAQALLWSSRGRVCREDNKYPAAIESYTHEATVREAHTAKSLALARALSDLAQVERDTGRVEESVQLNERALGLRNELAPDSLDVASSLTNLSVLERTRGDYGRAESLAARALSIQEKLAPDSLDVARTLNSLGAIAMAQSDPRACERYWRRALAIRKQMAPGSRDVAGSLNNLAIAVGERGDVATEEALYLQALKIYNPQSLGASVTLMNLGRLAHERGDLLLAESYYRPALAIQERLAPEGLDFALTLTNAGELAVAQEKLDAAESLYLRALAIRERAGSPAAGDTLLRLGDLALLRGNSAVAEGFFHRAQAIWEKQEPFGVAMIDRRLANLAAQRGDVAAAEKLLTKSLSNIERTHPSTHSAAQTLYDLAVLYKDTARERQAASLFLRALDIVDLLRQRQGRSKEASSYESYVSWYRDYTEVLQKLGSSDEALQVLERSRSMNLLAMLAERDLVLEADLPSELVRQRRELDSSYGRTESELASLDSQTDVQKVDVLRSQLRELRAQQRHLVEEVKKTSPHYAALQYPQTLDLAGTRAALDPGTLLLSYSIGKDRSFLFVVSGDPKRGPLLSVFTLPVGEKALRESVDAFRRLIEWNKSSPELLARSRSLYSTLLKPAEALIGKNDRLLILPDGPLHTLPWAALVVDMKAGQPQYLVERKPIHTAVSATVYAELRKSRHENRQSPAFEVAAFGDPKYPSLARPALAAKRGEGADETAEEPEDLDQDPNVRAAMRGGRRFDPLPHSREEVQSIASLYAPRSEAFLGEEATEERAKSLGKDIPLIHFACHAYLNERFPLDSALALTIPEHPKEGQDNGLLQAWEIFEKVRIDADLVTLSACESGLGKEMGGEGLIGLTRAFQYAGARSILASLWKVEDQSTGELMKRFYAYLKAGKTKDEALRLAQIDLIHSPDFSQPFHWAAFELIGDWK